MNLKRRVIAAEQFVLSVVDDGPISVAEMMTGWRDDAYRRRIGAARVRSEVLSFRRVMQEMLADDGERQDAIDAPYLEDQRTSTIGGEVAPNANRACESRGSHQ